MKMVMLVGAAAAAALMVGCGEPAKPAVSEAVQPAVAEESLGLRKTTIYSEGSTVAEKTEYATNAPGSGVKYERAYDNAPPMIPHDTEGMLPIQKENNACLGCHMPEIAGDVGATPIPASHFASFRPKTELSADGKVLKEGHTVANTSDVKVVVHKLNDLYQGRFNCSQCHAPQSTGEPLVKNNFRPDYQDDAMKGRSNLLDTLNVGVQ